MSWWERASSGPETRSKTCSQGTEGTYRALSQGLQNEHGFRLLVWDEFTYNPILTPKDFIQLE